MSEQLSDYGGQTVIKPCPFCGGGGTALYWDSVGARRGMPELVFLVCRICGAEGPNDESYRLATRKWNQRA